MAEELASFFVDLFGGLSSFKFGKELIIFNEDDKKVYREKFNLKHDDIIFVNVEGEMKYGREVG